MPSSCRVSLLGPGIEFAFQQGIGLRCRSESAPILTWSQGSVGVGIPTPATEWVLLSWPDAAPPVLLTFPGSTCSLRVSGSKSNWLVENAGPFHGVVRILPPLLDAPRPTDHAATLGRLLQELRPILPLVTQPLPSVTRLDVREEEGAVLGIWRFDRPGAIVPPAALLAPAGGYPLRIESATKEIGPWSQLAPCKVTAENKLVVRFPIRNLPPGRPLVSGWPEPNPKVALASNDVASVLTTAFTILSPERTATALSQAEGLTNDFLTAMPQLVEPLSGQALPYGQDGTNIDLVAAHAVLVACSEASGSHRGGPNALLLSVAVRRDWSTWLPWTPNPTLSHRAGALAAIAGLLGQDPDGRLAATMFHAGLAASRGLAIWKRSRGVPQEVPAPSVLLGPLRQALLGLPTEPGLEEFVQALRFPMRLLSGQSVQVQPRQGGVRMEWRRGPGDPSDLEVIVPRNTRIAKESNCTAIWRATTARGLHLRFRATSKGESWVELTLPPGVAAPPTAPFPNLNLGN
jgi:hypothetical protein